MLKLILMRHAKSSWGDPGLDDHARPLNDRGRRAARAMGAWLKDSGHTPSVVVSSDSARTIETWDCMRPSLAPDRVVFTDALYHASANTILRVLREVGASPALILCHNPGIADFAERIAVQPPDHPRFQDYPTASVAVITFQQPSWQGVGWSSGDVIDFVVPRDLGVAP